MEPDTVKDEFLDEDVAPDGLFHCDGVVNPRVWSGKAVRARVLLLDHKTLDAVAPAAPVEIAGLGLPVETARPSPALPPSLGAFLLVEASREFPTASAPLIRAITVASRRCAPPALPRAASTVEPPAASTAELVELALRDPAQLTNEQAQALSAPPPTDEQHFTARSLALPTAVHVECLHPSDARLPLHWAELCFPLPPPSTPEDPALDGAVMVDHLGFVLAANQGGEDSSAALSSLALFPVTSVHSDGSAVHGCVLQLPPRASADVDLRLPDFDPDGGSGHQRSAISDSGDCEVPAAGQISRLSSDFLAHLQLFVTPPADEAGRTTDEAASGGDAAPQRQQPRAVRFSVDGVGERCAAPASPPRAAQLCDAEDAEMEHCVDGCWAAVPPRAHPAEAECREPWLGATGAAAPVAWLQCAVAVWSSVPLHSALRALLLPLPALGDAEAVMASPAFDCLLQVTRCPTEGAVPNLAEPLPLLPASSVPVTAFSVVRLPRLDVPMQSLAMALRPSRVVALVEALAVGRKVLLVSAALTRLHSLSHALLALLYPFDWPHLHASFLPQSEFAAVLSSTSAALVGLHCDTWLEAERHLHAASASAALVLAVDVDDDRVLRDDEDAEGNSSSRGFPVLLRRSLTAALSRLYGGDCNDDQPLRHVAQPAAGVGGATDPLANAPPSLGSLLSSTAVAPQSESSAVLLRLAFVKAWSSVLRRWRSYCVFVPHSRSHCVLFDRDGFLQSRDADSAPLAAALLRSPAFTAFVAARCGVDGLREVDHDAFDRVEAALSGERPRLRADAERAQPDEQRSWLRPPALPVISAYR